MNSDAVLIDDPSTSTRGSVLLVEDDPDLAALVSIELEQAGMTVTHAGDGAEALLRLSEVLPDIILSDIMMPVMDGLELLKRLRADPRLRHVPVVMLTTKSQLGDIVNGFELGADDYILKPFRPEELVARVAAKILRPSIPVDQLPLDRRTGLLLEAAFQVEAQREWLRARRGSYPGIVACLMFDEWVAIRRRLGLQAEATISLQVGRMLSSSGDPLEVFGRGGDGTFWMLLPGRGPDEVREALSAFSQRLMGTRFEAGSEKVRLTPSIGFVAFADVADALLLLEHARIAAEHAATHLDLQPSRFVRAMVEEAAARRRLRPTTAQKCLERLRLPVQMGFTLVLAWGLPFLTYLGAHFLGFDLSWPVYVLVVIVICLTALLIWVEGVLAMRRVDPPPAAAYPPASAIIAAYLPNEAATLETTIEAFMAIDYPTKVQVVLAYNTPFDMPFEAVLKDLERKHVNFQSLRVEGSTSKAQNVNAALSLIRGDFVGVFDADHQPDPESFRRAWDWLESGYDIVQGHCFIRNGNASAIARMIAIEFEQIYAVSHPGRSRLHGFGIFGGSNGYWRSDLLRQIRFHGFMLTEDIDSSLRVIENGGKIASDPYLISRELAPTDLKGLTNQRLRWAQGWFQVSIKRVGPLLRSPHLSLRNKLGVFQLLVWREAFPWISLQIFPLVAFWAWRAGGLDRLDWFVPLLFALTAATLATGPGQIAFTWVLADRAHRARPGWFLFYVLASFFFYSEYKNLLSRVAQLKEALGERAWKVTPRSTG